MFSIMNSISLSVHLFTLLTFLLNLLSRQYFHISLVTVLVNNYPIAIFRGFWARKFPLLVRLFTTRSNYNVITILRGQWLLSLCHLYTLKKLAHLVALFASLLSTLDFLTSTSSELSSSYVSSSETSAGGDSMVFTKSSNCA